MLSLRNRKVQLMVGLAVLTLLVITSSSITRDIFGDSTHFIRKVEISNISMATSQKIGPVMVIVNAYMHTGSSYTGSIFQQHPGAFYHYEPLRNLQEKSRRHMSVQYLNGSHRRLSGVWLSDDVAKETVGNILNCRYGKVDIGTLSSKKYGIRGGRIKDQSPLLYCIERHRRDKDISRSDTVKNCLSYIVTPCLQAKLRAFKFIRLPMSPLKELITENRNLRVIHLVRDPRAMLDSQVRKNDMGSRDLSNFTDNTRRLCSKMHSDYGIHKSFPAHIRQYIKLLRYEDLIDSPLQRVEGLFRFSGLKMLEQDRKFVRQSTRKGDNSSGDNLETWRRHISQPYLDILNKYCRHVYKDFGYIEYQDVSDIRDGGKPTYLLHY